MLVEQGADDIVDQLVLPVEHIQGKGGHEGHKADNKQLSQELCEDFKNFLCRFVHSILIKPYHNVTKIAINFVLILTLLPKLYKYAHIFYQLESCPFA